MRGISKAGGRRQLYLRLTRRQAQLWDMGGLMEVCIRSGISSWSHKARPETRIEPRLPRRDYISLIGQSLAPIWPLLFLTCCVCCVAYRLSSFFVCLFVCSAEPHRQLHLTLTCVGELFASQLLDPLSGAFELSCCISELSSELEHQCLNLFFHILSTSTPFSLPIKIYL